MRLTESYNRLPSPADLIDAFPSPSSVIALRNEAIAVLEKRSHKKIVLVGPCSVHDIDSTLVLASQIQQLNSQLENLLLIMRVFIEKPRSRLGWKGFLYDPYLDGSNNQVVGLQLSRQLFCQILTMKVGCAMEILDPLISFYFEDLITWGLIGARTVASQLHRQRASSLPFPIGFKHETQGDLSSALDAIDVAQRPHSFFGLDRTGYIASIQGSGNPWTHLVLRGSDQRSNFDRQSVADAKQRLHRLGLQKRVMIDCSHGNCQKIGKQQRESFTSVIEQITEKEEGIIGVMLETHLFEGNQPARPYPLYGISVTDSCLGWDETRELLLWADQSIRSKIDEPTHPLSLLEKR